MAASPNVTWQDVNISRTRRWQALGARGATGWLSGLPASGKPTLGAALERRLVEVGVARAVDAVLSQLDGAGALSGALGMEQPRSRLHRGAGLGVIHQRNGVKP